MVLLVIVVEGDVDLLDGRTGVQILLLESRLMVACSVRGYFLSELI